MIFRIPSGVDLTDTERYFRNIWNGRTDTKGVPSGAAGNFGLLCYTNRSGSNLLANILKTAGLYGPQSFREYFNPDRMMQIQREHAIPGLQNYCQYLKGTRDVRFGAKINPRQLVFLAKTGLLAAEYPQAHFIYIDRQDRLDQAISLVKAEITQQWTKTVESESVQPQNLVYDANRIAQAIHRLAESAKTFEVFFALNGIKPARVVYEQLAANPKNTVESLLDQLGVARPRDLDKVISRVRTKLTKQADLINDNWRAAFLREVNSS